MPVRRRTTGSSNYESQCSDTVVKSPIHLPTDTCKLIQPRCVQGRVFYVHVDRHHGDTTFIISEATNRDSELRWKEYRNVIANSAFVVQYGGDRVIGTPHVIGCHGDHVIMQVLLADFKKIVFVYAELNSGCAKLLSDGIHYFPMDLLIQGNVQCLWSPDRSCIILTMPENCMKPNTDSKVLIADIHRTGDGVLDLQPIRDSRFTLHKRKMVAFDPRKSHHATALTFHPYCQRYKIEKWNIKDGTCEHIEFVNNTRSSTSRSLNDCRDSDLIVSGCESTDAELRQSHIDYSKSGRYIIVLCLCAFMNSGLLRIRVVILDSGALNPVKISGFQMKREESVSDLFVSTTDRTDSTVIIWSQVRGRPVKEIGRVDLPFDMSLQALCRKTIRSRCKQRDMNKLPISPRLINQLSFKHL